MVINNVSAFLVSNGQITSTVSLSKVQASTFTPESDVVYIAVANSGSEKNKVVKALFSNSSAVNEIINSDDYDLYKSGELVTSASTDVILKLTIKDSLNEITVGVPEALGAAFPIETANFPTVFSVN